MKRLAAIGIAGFEGAFWGLLVLALTLTLAGAAVLAWIALASGATSSMDSLVPNSTAVPSRSAGLRVSGTPSQQATVRRAVDELVWPVETSAFSVVVKSPLDLPRGTEGTYSFPGSVIYLNQDVVDGPLRQHTAYVLAHELGHMFDSVYLDGQGRSEFLRLRGFLPGTDWLNETAPWSQRPAEDFAQVFAAFDVSPGTVRTRTVAGRVSNPDAVRALIVRYQQGPARSTSVQVGSALSIVREATDSAHHDPVVGSTLVSLALVCAIYGASDAIRNLSRRPSSAAGQRLLHSRAGHRGA